MGTPAVIDLESLVAPISDSQPAGVDLSEESVLSDLHSLSNAARTAEKKWAQLPMGPDGKPHVPDGTQPPPIPNWNPVVKLATELLRTKSKDLTVCALLLEALCRTHGFAGLRDGSLLVQQLTEKYWGQLFPPFSQELFEAYEDHPTITQISGLNGSSLLPFAIDRIPLLTSPVFRVLTGVDYLDAYGKGLKVSREHFESCVNNTSAETFATLLDDADAALNAYRTMAELLNTRCRETDDAPGPASSSVEEALSESIRRIRHISGRTESGEVSEESEPSEAGPLPAGANRASIPNPGTGALQSREEAYEMLRKVADFFSRTEPHSPVSTALKRIVSWRNLTFPELMKELVDNDDSRREVYRLTGYREEE